jgi:MFS family permease
VLREVGPDARLYLLTSIIVGLTVLPGIPSVLLNLYLLRLGYGPEFVGVLSGVASLGFALSCLPAGALGERWGVRRAMIAGLAVAALGYIAMPLGELVQGLMQQAWLGASRLLVVWGLALFFVNSRPFVMAVTRDEGYTHVFPLRAALQPLGGFLGALVAGLLPGLLASAAHLTLEHPMPYRYPLMLSGVLLIPGIWIMRQTRRLDAVGPAGNKTQQQGAAASVAWGVILILALVSLCRGVGLGAMWTFFNVYMDSALKVSTSLIGSLRSVGQLLGVALALLTPLVVSRWSNSTTYVLGVLGMAGSMLLIATVPVWEVAGLGSLGMSGLSAVTLSTINVYQMEIIAARERTTMSGVTSMAMGLSRSAVSLGGGFLVSAMGYSAIFGLGAGVMALGGLIFWLFDRYRQRVS